MHTNNCCNVLCCEGLVAAQHVGSQSPDLGSNPCPLHYKADSQTLGHQESPLSSLFWQEEWGTRGKVTCPLPCGRVRVWTQESDHNATFFFKLALPLWLHIKGLEIVFSFLDVPAQGDPLGEGLLNKWMWKWTYLPPRPVCFCPSVSMSSSSIHRHLL